MVPQLLISDEMENPDLDPTPVTPRVLQGLYRSMALRTWFAICVLG